MELARVVLPHILQDEVDNPQRNLVSLGDMFYPTRRHCRIFATTVISLPRIDLPDMTMCFGALNCPISHQDRNNWECYEYFGASEVKKAKLQYAAITVIAELMFNDSFRAVQRQVSVLASSKSVYRG